jgi:uncharacterized membrane protein (UPF0127 family)
MIRFGFWGAAFFCILSGIAGCEDSSALKTIKLDLNGREFTVEIADTPAARAKGLMFRKTLPENAGMLFVFERDSRETFWMENTDIPLSLAYISRTGEIREIFDLTPRSRRPVPSTYAIRYALEVNQGVFEKLGLRPGHILKIPELPPPSR